MGKKGVDNFMPVYAKDLTGQKFNMLTVIERVENAPNGNAQFLCLCDCGNQVIVTGSHLRNNEVKSCGCIAPGKPKHHESNTPLYKKWKDMLRRCEDPKRPCYANYGGRGIQVCNEWHDYENFRDWTNSTRDDSSLTLDRIDVNGNYCPDNCRWVNQKTQQNNKRNNMYITYFDETHSLSEWCDILNLPYSVIYSRIHLYNWDFWTAISTPLPAHYYNDCYDYDYSYEYYEDPYEYDNYDNCYIC